jgi:hypothetical protein
MSCLLIFPSHPLHRFRTIARELRELEEIMSSMLRSHSSFSAEHILMCSMQIDWRFANLAFIGLAGRGGS